MGRGGLEDGGATACWEAPVLIIHSQPDDYSESFSGNHPGLTTTSMPQGCFLYWKGLEPSEVLKFDSCLVAQSTLRRTKPAGSWKVLTTPLNFTPLNIDALPRQPQLLYLRRSHDWLDKLAAPMTTSTTRLD
jgi:hypothetical protein